MITIDSRRDGVTSPAPATEPDDHRYMAWFHELDAWTEYWDIYHPETRGRYYFGDGDAEPGLLTRFLPRTQYPPPWVAWTRMALGVGSPGEFLDEVCRPKIASAVMEIDALQGRLFAKYFGDASDSHVQADYLEAIFRFATDSLPPALERTRQIPDEDWRKRTAGRYTLDGDLMWFAWALQLEAAEAVANPNNVRDAGIDPHRRGLVASGGGEQKLRGDGESHRAPDGKYETDRARRTLLLAGVASGCPANFAWRGHRRTRTEYRPGSETTTLLRSRGLEWASNFAGAAEEVHALYRIREWGEDA
jgi:hypothetical protein